MDELATKRFEFRLTPKQMKTLEDKANKAGLRKTEFLIKLIEGKEILQPMTKQELILITGVANNLNQLTRFAHLGNLNIEGIKEILQKLKKAIC